MHMTIGNDSDVHGICVCRNSGGCGACGEESRLEGSDCRPVEHENGLGLLQDDRDHVGRHHSYVCSLILFVF